jgi:hypothetical protein
VNFAALNRVLLLVDADRLLLLRFGGRPAQLILLPFARVARRDSNCVVSILIGDRALAGVCDDVPKAVGMAVGSLREFGERGSTNRARQRSRL